jgi:hypothetical protein
MVPFIPPIFCFTPTILGVPITMAPLLGILFLWVVTCGAYFNTAILQEMRSFILRIWYSLSSERLVNIKITKFYVEKVVPSARKI